MSGSRFLRGSSRGSSAESLSDVDEKEKAHMVMREQFKLFDEKEEGFDKEMMKAVLLKGDDAMPLDEAEEVVNEFFQVSSAFAPPAQAKAPCLGMQTHFCYSP